MANRQPQATISYTLLVFFKGSSQTAQCCYYPIQIEDHKKTQRLKFKKRKPYTVYITAFYYGFGAINSN